MTVSGSVGVPLDDDVGPSSRLLADPSPIVKRYPTDPVVEVSSVLVPGACEIMVMG
jgi:hypothetical protein